MTAIVPLSGGAKLPAYLQNRAALANINSEAVTHMANYGSMSIKGKVFTLVKGDERKILTRPEDPDEVAQSITVAVVRANPKCRTFYAKTFNEDDKGEAARPDCHSFDGITPAADARDKQSTKCATCPHAAWGTKVNGDGKGTACTVVTRLSILDPDTLLGEKEAEPLLLRVPAGSRSNFSEVVKKADARGIPYNALALKIGFDPTAPAPKLTFKIAGLLDDAAYDAMGKLYENETVKEMVGLIVPRAPAEEAAQPGDVTDEDIEAALAAKEARAKAAQATRPAPAKEVAKEAIAKAAAKPTPKAAPAPAPAPAEDVTDDELDAALNGKAAAPAPAPAPAARAKPTAKAAPAPAPAPAPAAEEGDMDGLLGDLESLLGSTDD